MSNISLINEETAANIGGFMVGRLLPFRQKRAVGPFVFIDHMGPADLKAFESLDVGPHPHIGLSTLTYLFEGAMMHRDSIGSELEIKPGAVNWMTAGKGVVHSERTPDYLRASDKRLHGLQIWVALPKELEQIEPTFNHYSADELPRWKQNGLSFKLIAGQVFGRKSPVAVHSRLYFIEIYSAKVQQVDIGTDLFGESALYILDGEIRSEGNTYGPKQILIANDSTLCSFEIGANTTLYIFGGESLNEEHFIYWNFVSSDKGRIEKAKLDWQNGLFPTIPTDSGLPVPGPWQNNK